MTGEDGGRVLVVCTCVLAARSAEAATVQDCRLEEKRSRNHPRLFDAASKLIILSCGQTMSGFGRRSNQARDIEPVAERGVVVSLRLRGSIFRSADDCYWCSSCLAWRLRFDDN
jgi:hypothetical protein